MTLRPTFQGAVVDWHLGPLPAAKRSDWWLWGHPEDGPPGPCQPGKLQGECRQIQGVDPGKEIVGRNRPTARKLRRMWEGGPAAPAPQHLQGLCTQAQRPDPPRPASRHRTQGPQETAKHTQYCGFPVQQSVIAHAHKTASRTMHQNQASPKQAADFRGGLETCGTRVDAQRFSESRVPHSDLPDLGGCQVSMQARASREQTLAKGQQQRPQDSQRVGWRSACGSGGGTGIDILGRQGTKHPQPHSVECQVTKNHGGMDA